MDTIRILCVDDDLAVLRSLENVLTCNGFSVEAVPTVTEALNLISRRPFDVLLSDLNIGEPGDGFTVVSAMRRVQPHASTFILTGYPDIESAIRAIRSQVDDYFPKPLNVRELLSAITASRDTRRAASKLHKPVRMGEFIRQNKDRFCGRWLAEISKYPDLSSIQLHDDQRINRLTGFLDELALQLEEKSENEASENRLSPAAVEDARHHGRLRYEQGYTIPQVVSETRILQQVMSATIQEELMSIDLSSLIPDLTMIGEFMQSALEISIRAYQSQTPNSLQSSFASLYSSPHLGVAIANESRVLDANDAFLRMIQHSREQLTAGEIDWGKMTPEEYRSLDLNGFEQLRVYGACVPFEKEYVLPDGTRKPFLIGAVRLSIEPLQWCGYTVDLTEQRSLQAAERKARDWEAKYALINRLAHEINNPLAALMFTVHLLGTHAGVSGDACCLVRDAAEMLDRVSAVVKQVLEESRRASA